MSLAMSNSGIAKWLDGLRSFGGKSTGAWWKHDDSSKCTLYVNRIVAKIENDVKVLVASNVTPGGVGTALSLIRGSLNIKANDCCSSELLEIITPPPSSSAVHSWNVRNDAIGCTLDELNNYISGQFVSAGIQRGRDEIPHLPSWVSGPASTEYFIYQYYVPSRDIQSNIEVNSGKSGQNEISVANLAAVSNETEAGNQTNFMKKTASHADLSSSPKTTESLQHITPLTAAFIGKDDHDPKLINWATEPPVENPCEKQNSLRELSLIAKILLSGASSTPNRLHSKYEVGSDFLYSLICSMRSFSVQNRHKVVCLMDLLLTIPNVPCEVPIEIDSNSSLEPNTVQQNTCMYLSESQRCNALRSYLSDIQKGVRKETSYDCHSYPLLLMRPMSRYFMSHPESLIKICDGAVDLCLAVPCGGMLQSVIRLSTDPWLEYTVQKTDGSDGNNSLDFDRLESLVFLRWLLIDHFHLPFWVVEVLGTQSFVVMAQGFEILKELLLNGNPASRCFLEAFQDTFFDSYRRKILLSNEYTCQRIGAKLLFDIISDPSHSRLMSRFTKESSNLNTVLRLLLSVEQDALVFEAFHLLKIFVISPRKPKQIEQILTKYRNDILLILNDLKFANRTDDLQFANDRMLTIGQMLEFKPTH